MTNEENQNSGNNAVTETANDNVAEQPNNSQKNTSTTEERTNPSVFSEEQQARINSIVQERLERDRKSLYARLGVENEEQLQEKIKNGNAYSSNKDNYERISKENIFLKNGIDPERYEEIESLFKGRNVPLTDESLKEELSKHSDWTKNTTKTTVQNIGHSSENSEHSDSSERNNVAKNAFGLPGFVSPRRH